MLYMKRKGFSIGSTGKESACNTGDTRDAGSIPGLRRSTREGNGNPLQHSCLGNPMERGAWWVTIQRVTNSRTQLSDTAEHMQTKGEA